MLVINNTSENLVAFCWRTDRGYGDDVTIQQGESKEVSGPYIGEMGNGSCYTVVPGEIACQEHPDDENGFQILPGKQLNLQFGKVGVTVRHFSEERVIDAEEGL